MKKIICNKTVQSWLWLFALFLLWELSARFGLVNIHLMPPLSNVAVSLAKELFQGNLSFQVANSMIMILQGFSLSFVLALIISLLCIGVPQITSLVNMLITIMNPLPSVAIMPLIVMWFGINNGAMLAIIVHGVLWALVQHLIDGMRSIPSVYREWSVNIGLSPFQKFTDIFVFAVMPDLLIGIRVSWGRAWRALISAEMVFGMIGSFGGLGYYIYLHRAYSNITNVMSGIVIIVIIGILVESLLFKQIEKHTIKKWGMVHE